jgi:hypothetical protein
MDPQDSTELISSDHHSSQEKKGARNLGAMVVSVMAMVLALASILAANIYAFYQAKSVRQTQYKLNIDQLELELAKDPKMSPAAREAFDKKLTEYRATVERYESEPKTQEGKKELLARAKAHEAARDLAGRRDPWFDYAEGLLQIGIVIVSVSMIASQPWLLWAGVGLGFLGFFSTLNGFFLLF